MSEIQKTIHGTADFCYITTPDVGFGSNQYKVTLRVKKADAAVHTKALQGIISKEVAEQHKLTPNITTPLKRANLPYAEDGEYIVFKFHSKFKPKLWNKNQKELGADVSVWKGSSMWINYKASGYNKSVGLGVTLYMQSVQIDELVEGSAANGSCPFPKRSEEATA